MRAFTLDSFDSEPALRDDLPTPKPGDGEVLVRVHGSSANPFDNAAVSGLLRPHMEYVFPVTLGRDFAGTVEALGAGVDRFAAGDEVYGFLSGAQLHDGTLAEYVAVAAGQLVAHKPRTIGFDGAGVTPLAGTTAMIAVEAIDVAEGDRVLILGATGGVGSFATQLVADRGGHVIAPALSDDERYLRELGAAELIERNGDVVAAVRERYPDGLDSLIDVVSFDPQTFAATAATLKRGGRAVSPTNSADPDADGIVATNIAAYERPSALAEVAELIDQGTLRVPIQRTYALEQAPDALRDLQSSHTQGKLAITVP
jgi:NADPH:quinone reductase